MDEESYWLDDWLLFETLKKKFDGRPWHEWPKKYRDRDPTALDEIEVMQLHKHDLWVAGRKSVIMLNRRISV